MHHLSLTSSWWMVAHQLLHYQNRLLGEKLAHQDSAKQHSLKSCWCNFAAIVIQFDKLTCVFKNLFPRHVSFNFRCSQCRSPFTLVACCQCHLVLFPLFSTGCWHLQGWCLLLLHKRLLLCDKVILRIIILRHCSILLHCLVFGFQHRSWSLVKWMTFMRETYLFIVEIM